MIKISKEIIHKKKILKANNNKKFLNMNIFLMLYKIKKTI